MAETTEDEREQRASEDEREPQASDDEQHRATEEKRGSQASEDERKPEASQERGEQEADQEPNPPDLPEPEEKSTEDLIGQQVVDPHGYTIGKIEALFIYSQDERARWARVKTGLIRTSSVFVPLHDAQDDGGQIRVVYEKEHVNAAPEIEPEGNELSDDDADVLHGHYGMERVKGLTTEGADDIELSREARDAQPPTMKEPPWSIEKYPLPDMERPEDEGSQRQAGPDPEGSERQAGPDAEGSQRQAGPDPEGSERQAGPDAEGSQRQDSSDENSEERSREAPSGEGSGQRAGG